MRPIVARPAIRYSAEAYSTSGQKLMGRNVAGESFLRALSLWPNDGKITALVENESAGRSFAASVSRWNSNLRAETIRIDPSELGQSGGLFLGDPALAEYAWRRAGYGTRSWSLCGLTHTISTHVVMDALAAIPTAPVEPWDALICTSHAVKAAVLTIFEAESDNLRRRLGPTQIPLPMLPVLPLGVHAPDFAIDPANRAAARETLSLGNDTVVVLFVGRLMAHAKANPIPLYLALEQTALQTTRDIALIEYGRFPNTSIEAAYATAAQTLCPSIRRIVIDGAAEAPARAWAAADIFSSLADNIQETFGITPVEAMAAGLPVVVSDWNGYRDTVRDGVDGFRIPTVLPRGGLGGDFAEQHMLGLDSYDQYVGYTSAATAVDIDAATAAFVRLIESASLRQEMGAAGQERVRREYDWRVLLPKYDDLWSEMADRRRQGVEAATHCWPARDDPFWTFAGYASGTLSEHTMVALAHPNAAVAFARFKERVDLAVIGYANSVMAREAEVETMLTHLEAAPLPAGNVAALTEPHRQNVALRSVAWLLKLGILRRVA